MSAAPTPDLPDERLTRRRRTAHRTGSPAERLTAERLDALGHVQGAPGSRLPRVLFVCSRNAGRSQMAAALPQYRAGGRVTLSCAGTRPGPGIEPHIAQVRTETGADAVDAFPEPLTDEAVPAADIVITDLLDSLPGT